MSQPHKDLSNPKTQVFGGVDREEYDHVCKEYTALSDQCLTTEKHLTDIIDMLLDQGHDNDGEDSRENRIEQAKLKIVGLITFKEAQKTIIQEFVDTQDVDDNAFRNEFRQLSSRLDGLAEAMVKMQNSAEKIDDELASLHRNVIEELKRIRQGFDQSIDEDNCLFDRLAKEDITKLTLPLDNIPLSENGMKQAGSCDDIIDDDDDYDQEEEDGERHAIEDEGKDGNIKIKKATSNHDSLCDGLMVKHIPWTLCLNDNMFKFLRRDQAPVIGFTGMFSSGKSFLLEIFLGTRLDNIGHFQHTEGIQFILAKVKIDHEDENGQSDERFMSMDPFLFLDSPGIEAPINFFSTHHQHESDTNHVKLTQVQDFFYTQTIQSVSDMVCYVVNKLTGHDVEIITKFEQSLKDVVAKKLIVIHNLMHSTDVEDLITESENTCKAFKLHNVNLKSKYAQLRASFKAWNNYHARQSGYDDKHKPIPLSIAMENRVKHVFFLKHTCSGWNREYNNQVISSLREDVQSLETPNDPLLQIETLEDGITQTVTFPRLLDSINSPAQLVFEHVQENPIKTECRPVYGLNDDNETEIISCNLKFQFVVEQDDEEQEKLLAKSDDVKPTIKSIPPTLYIDGKLAQALPYRIYIMPAEQIQDQIDAGKWKFKKEFQGGDGERYWIAEFNLAGVEDVPLVDDDSNENHEENAFTDRPKKKAKKGFAVQLHTNPNPDVGQDKYFLTIDGYLEPLPKDASMTSKYGYSANSKKPQRFRVSVPVDPYARITPMNFFRYNGLFGVVLRMEQIQDDSPH